MTDTKRENAGPSDISTYLKSAATEDQIRSLPRLLAGRERLKEKADQQERRLKRRALFVTYLHAPAHGEAADFSVTPGFCSCFILLIAALVLLLSSSAADPAGFPDRISRSTAAAPYYIRRSTSDNSDLYPPGGMASRTSSDSRELQMNEQLIINTYANMRTEVNQIYSKITELEMEHSLVIGAIQPLDPSRRCYRMVGGVLVERTIKEVLPAVQHNKEGLEVVIARLNEALEKKKKEISEFELKYKIKIRKADSETKEDTSPKEGSAQGVLVGPAS